MEAEQCLMDLRRTIVEGLAARADLNLTLVKTLEQVTTMLLKAGVNSLGDVGRMVYVFGFGNGVVVGVTYAEVTTFTIYMIISRQIKKYSNTEAFEFYDVN